MTPVEILNTLAERRNPSHRPFVDPDEYDESGIKKINGKLYRIDRGEYLKDFIIAFLVNVTPLKETVNTMNSFGESDDVVFSTGALHSKKTHRIRILRRRDDIGREERVEIAYWQTGTYLIVQNLNDFYSWYIKEFGEVTV